MHNLLKQKDNSDITMSMIYDIKSYCINEDYIASINTKS